MKTATYPSPRTRASHRHQPAADRPLDDHRLRDKHCHLLRSAGAHAGQEALETKSGRDDLVELREFIRETGPEDPRATVAVARLQALQRRWAPAS